MQPHLYFGDKNITLQTYCVAAILEFKMAALLKVNGVMVSLSVDRYCVSCILLNNYEIIVVRLMYETKLSLYIVKNTE
jgi:hypothetical protein